jgi:hypothetical protein
MPILSLRGLQRDVVYLDWPIAPSYTSPNARRRGVEGSQPVSTAVLRSPSKPWRSNSIFNLWSLPSSSAILHPNLRYTTPGPLFFANHYLWARSTMHRTVPRAESAIREPCGSAIKQKKQHLVFYCYAKQKKQHLVFHCYAKQKKQHLVFYCYAKRMWNHGMTV